MNTTIISIWAILGISLLLAILVGRKNKANFFLTIIRFVVFAFALLLVFLLIRFFAKKIYPPAGTMSDSDGYVAYSDEECNYIVIRGEEIILNNKAVNDETIKAFIIEHVDNNIPIVLIDDYADAIYFHQVITMCKDECVNFEIQVGY